MDRWLRKWWRMLVGGIAGTAALVVAVVAVARVGEASDGEVAVEAAVAIGLALVAARTFHRASPPVVADVVGVIGAVAAVAAVVAVTSAGPDGRATGPAGCEGVSGDGRGFAAEPDGGDLAATAGPSGGAGVPFRSRPETSSPLDVLGRLLPAGCLVGFDGFCIGEPLADPALPNGPRDQRWFLLPDDHGYVPGAAVDVLPPGTNGRAPADCPDGRTEPTEIALSSEVPEEVDGPVRLDVQAPGAVTVAAAVRVQEPHGAAEWRRIGMDPTASDGFSIVWNPISASPQAGATVVYTVCWAAGSPGRAFDAVTVDLVGSGGEELPTTPAPLPDELLRGQAVACEYPPQ
jgi:hypothetical protein